MSDEGFALGARHEALRALAAEVCMVARLEHHAHFPIHTDDALRHCSNLNTFRAASIRSVWRSHPWRFPRRCFLRWIIPFFRSTRVGTYWQNGRKWKWHGVREVTMKTTGKKKKKDDTTSTHQKISPDLSGVTSSRHSEPPTDKTVRSSLAISGIDVERFPL